MVGKGELRLGLTIDHVSYCRAFKILGDRVDCAGKMSHGVERSGTIHNINIEESDECKAKLPTSATQVPVQDIERLLDGMEGDHLFEEVEHLISGRRVREVCDSRVARPGGDRDQSDTSNNRALDSVHKQDGSKHATAEDPNPHGWRAHLRRGWTCTIHHFGCNATSKLDRGARRSSDEADSRAVAQADDSWQISIRCIGLRDWRNLLK